MSKVNNKDNSSGVFIVNFEHISHLALVFLFSQLLDKFLMENFIFCAVNVIEGYLIPIPRFNLDFQRLQFGLHKLLTSVTKF